MTAAAALVVVAHPDDETIFFGGSIRRLTACGVQVDVVAVTSVFAAGSLTSLRRAEFRRACWLLGARARMLTLTDVGGPLDPAVLHAVLEQRVRWGHYQLVLTHGVWGEYGHPHHMQVCRAVHRLAPNVLSLAGPFPTRARHRLGPLAFAAKRSIAATSYLSQPFAAHWCTDEEGFVRWPVDDASYLAGVGLGEAPPGQPGAGRWLPVHEDGYPDVAHIDPALWRLGHRERCRRLHDEPGPVHHGADSPSTDFSNDRSWVGHI